MHSKKFGRFAKYKIRSLDNFLLTFLEFKNVQEVLSLLTINLFFEQYWKNDFIVLLTLIIKLSIVFDQIRIVVSSANIIRNSLNQYSE